MINAYEIGARIVLNDDILSTTQKWADQLTGAQRLIDRISAALERTVDLTSTAAGAAERMASAFTRAADGAERLQRASGGLGGAWVLISTEK